MSLELFSTVFATSFSSFITVFIGALLRKYNRLNDQTDESLLWIFINILYPALIMSAIMNNSSLKNPEDIFAPPLLGFSSVLLSLGLGLLFYKHLGLKGEKEQRTFLLASSLNNYGIVPVLLVLALYSHETLGILFLYNMGVELALWTVGILIICSQITLKARFERLLNAPLCALVGSLFIHFLGIDKYLPQFVTKTSNLLGYTAIPLALMLAGSLMYDSVKTYKIRDGIKTMGGAVVIRLLLFPIVYLMLICLLPLSTELKNVMLVQAAQPAAVISIVLAKQYNSCPYTAFLVIFATFTGSVLTMPFWVLLGSYLL